ncbi:hypothetical protein EVAR_61450_1 [Eumeta japonica]|uniref:Uncharacterized protein n=1 Tax=Eumeta variegata TaxID=151549 RepID=A0A4C1Z2I6_EUMVA|nr:hypothetical protein EVAR_61450_1 [Eumeta japonica]
MTEENIGAVRLMTETDKKCKDLAVVTQMLCTTWLQMTKAGFTVTISKPKESLLSGCFEELPTGVKVTPCSEPMEGRRGAGAALG